MPLYNTSMGGSTPKTLVTPDGITDSIAIEKVDGKTVKPSSTLGNATADKVLQGYTFTSDGGFDIAGTSTAASDLEAAQGEIAELENEISQSISLVEKSISGITDIENIAKSISTTGKMVHISNTIPKGTATTTTILNISGSGKLHFAKFDGYNNNYIKITFDNSFVMYVDCSGYYYSSDTFEQGYYAAHDCFKEFSFMMDSGDYIYYSIDGKHMSINAGKSVDTPCGDFTVDGRPSYSSIPIEATTVDTKKRFITTPRPLKFDSSLKIEGITSHTTGGITSDIFYSLD